MLSQNEIKLCSNMNMAPTRFITLKTVLLSGSDHSYAIKKEPQGGTDSAAINSSHIHCIKKYLTKAGWLAGGGGN